MHADTSITLQEMDKAYHRGFSIARMRITFTMQVSNMKYEFEATTLATTSSRRLKDSKSLIKPAS